MSGSIINQKFSYFSEEFVISAGCVLFSEDHSSICLLHETERDEWLLPKGRKDQGESIADAAVRETYEETGYHCALYPVRMATRAPPAGSDLDNTKYNIVEKGTEPIAVHIRPTGQPPVATKLVFWFIAQADGSEQVKGSQMSYETFEAIFLQTDEAIKRLTFEDDRKVVEKAWVLVRDSR